MSPGLIAPLQFIVSPPEARVRLDRFVASKRPELSRTRVQRLIRDGFIQLNGSVARPSQIVRTGNCVSLSEPAPRQLQLEAEEIALAILFEDEDLIVLNKPAGMSVHPGAGRNSGTLVNALLAHCADLSGIGGTQRPGIVHRLDRQTSGCLAVAKNDIAHLQLSKQFAARTVEKIYLALVAGKLRRNSGTIDAPIARHRIHRQRMAIASDGGREARTDFRVIRSGPEATLLECRLHSGRTHQIRVHLQHLGHPILGDKVYAGRRAGSFPRQMLHALKLSFDHPRTGQRLSLEASLPEDFREAIEKILP